MAVSEPVLDAVRAGMRGLQPPKHFDKVYKDECMFSFDTPESPGGLFVNLKTYQVQKLGSSSIHMQQFKRSRSFLGVHAACMQLNDLSSQDSPLFQAS
jgi:ubiquitin carboxyl-terminal hydrolase 5/13